MVRARIVNSSYEDKTTKIKKYSDNTSSVGTGDYLAPIIVTSAYVDSNLAIKMITLNLIDSKLMRKKDVFRIGKFLLEHLSLDLSKVTNITINTYKIFKKLKQFFFYKIYCTK